MIQIYLDMDGVLADFESAMRRALGDEQDRLHEKFVELGLDHLPNLDWVSLKNAFKGEQKNPEMAQAKKLYNRFRARQYALMGKEGWFYNLDPLPWAEDLIHRVGEIHRSENDGLPHILTAPVRSDFCKPEKEMWMRKHFPDLYDEFHCTQEKFLHANDRSILIDDNLKFVNPFREHGGLAVHFQGDLDHSINELLELIDRVKS